MDESIHVFRNRKTQDYLIQRYSGVYAAGKFVKLPAIQAQEKCLDIIVDIIKDKSLPANDEVPELKAFTNEERRAFFRQHPHVFVALRENILSIGPFHKERAGFVAPKDEIVRIPLPSTNEEFFSALNRAFETAD